MHLLLDTHIAIWAFDDSDRLPQQARELILTPDNQLFVSVVSAWEIALKHGVHPDKLPYGAQRFVQLCQDSGFREVALTHADVLAYEKLALAAASNPHKDPFDRMLIAQAKTNNMLFITHDQALARYEEPLVVVV